MRNSSPVAALFLQILFFSIFLWLFIAGVWGEKQKTWRDQFHISECRWSSVGRNDFFILQPGYKQILEGRENGRHVTLEVTVLNETKKVASVETRVVEEKETQNGRLVEISRNFFAVCMPAKDVYYFGEEVLGYEDGVRTDNQEGAWIADQKRAKAGLYMPANPRVGDRFFQELAPGIAMDRIEILSKQESLKTAAGEFHNCLKVEETTPLEPGVSEYKLYAKGVGVIRDGDLVLTKVEFAPPDDQ